MIAYRSRKTKFYDSFISMGVYLIIIFLMVCFASLFVNIITAMPVRKVTELIGEHV